MAFTLICYSAKHLELANDGDNARFLFDVVRDAAGHLELILAEAPLRPGEHAPEAMQVTQDAARFASACADAFGLR